MTFLCKFMASMHRTNDSKPNRMPNCTFIDISWLLEMFERERVLILITPNFIAFFTSHESRCNVPFVIFYLSSGKCLGIKENINLFKDCL